MSEDRVDVALDAVIRECAPHAPSPLPRDLSLGEGGLELDSVAIVDLLMSLEKRLGTRFPADLFAEAPPTLGVLADSARAQIERDSTRARSSP